MTVGKDAFDPQAARERAGSKIGRSAPSSLLDQVRSRFRNGELRRSRTFIIALVGGIVAALAIAGLSIDRGEPPVEALTEADTAAAVAVDPEPEAPREPPFIGPEAPDIHTTEGTIEPNQFMASMLEAAGLTGGEADRTVHALDGIFDPTKSRPGDRYRVDVFDDGSLARFEYQPGPDEVYVVSRDLDGSLMGLRVNVSVDMDIVEVEGEIEHSLWLAFEASGESPVLAANLTDAFQFDIDFFHDTRKGDSFRFFVEKFTHNGELVRYGQIHAAEYIGAKGSPIGTKRLYWYDNPETRTKGFYDEEGKAAQRAFLRSPLKFTRISSGFGYRRHPILGKRHFHGGIDYAAPRGTPVRSVAAGTVILATYAGANGKIVKINHAGGYQSFYLHLSKIMVRKGQQVGQSTIIGKVGSTGRSTGPHLDFRIKRHGKYLNPRRTVAPRTKAVPRKEREVFKAAITPWMDRLRGDGADLDDPMAKGS